MSILLSVVLLIIGLGLVTYGANWLVSGASSLSLRLGIAPIIIGLTIVAFGTSAPELVVSIIAATNGNADIALGNVIGSNIANILLILGVTTLLSPLTVARNTYLKEIPLALLAAVVLWVISNDTLLGGAVVSSISRGDGIILLLFFVIFLYYIFEMVYKKETLLEIDVPERPMGSARSWALLLMGLVSLVAGGKLFVTHAAMLARLAGLSELLIGLTIVSIGTSLPELATSIVAARQGKSDLVIGNIIGSNIFNILWILGVTALITPIAASTTSWIDMIILIAVTLLLIISIFTGTKGKITRHEGVFMLLGYVGYLTYIMLRG